MSRFEQVQAAPPIAIFALSQAFKQDNHPKKVDLGIGAYRDNTARPWVLPVVRKAQIAIANDESLNMEYLSQLGLPEFTSAATNLLLGADSPVIKENRVVSCQTLSGTGALALSASLLIKVMKYKTVYYSKPTWGNHLDIFKYAGCDDVRPYRYWDAVNRRLDFEGMTEDLRAAPKDSIIIFHACAHNPTGIDPTDEQWKIFADICEERGLFPLFDCAYQGFASGSVDNDIKSFRYFVSRGFETLCCQSFAKNFGLYNQRVGNLAIVVKDPSRVEPLKSQLSLHVRWYYSNPPANGARIVAKVLNDPTLLAEWKQAIQEMSSRIISMRKALRQHLEDLKTPGTWNHITDQIGMFSYTGLNVTQVKYLISEFHIYLPDDGRISLAGLNSENVKYVAEAINRAVQLQ
uniref:Aspartate aminotransferase n=1 Tax=Aceria tosichella TaxID=561515 RepID=A0A6G1SGU6_9ACAR